MKTASTGICSLRLFRPRSSRDRLGSCVVDPVISRKRRRPMHFVICPSSGGSRFCALAFVFPQAEISTETLPDVLVSLEDLEVIALLRPGPWSEGITTLNPEAPCDVIPRGSGSLPGLEFVKLFGDCSLFHNPLDLMRLCSMSMQVSKGTADEG